MEKQYTFQQIVQSLPKSMLLDALNEVTGLKLNRFGDLPIEAECIGLEEYISEVNEILLINLFSRGQSLPGNGDKSLQSITLSEQDIREISHPWISILDKLIYEIHASPTDTPYKFGFEFISNVERERISALNYQDIQESLTPRDFSRAEPSKTFFDKESFLRNLKNRLWQHLDNQYSLRAENE